MQVDLHLQQSQASVDVASRHMQEIAQSGSVGGSRLKVCFGQISQIINVTAEHLLLWCL